MISSLAVMVIIANHRVQDNYISDGQKVHELEEFQTEHTRIGIPGIPDAGTSPPVAIIEQVNLCIHNIRKKKSSKGDDRRERQHLEKKFKAIVTHRNSDEYIMTQLMVLDRVESVIKEIARSYALLLRFITFFLFFLYKGSILGIVFDANSLDAASSSH